MEKDQRKSFIALHGFLGEPNDFAPLVAMDLPVQGIDLRPARRNFVKWDDLCEQVLNEIRVLVASCVGEIWFVGYSMGGRILLDVLRRAEFLHQDLNQNRHQQLRQDLEPRMSNLPHLGGVIFLSSHLGLYVDAEVDLKHKFNASCLQILRERGALEFLKYWQTLDLFKYDTPLLQTSWDEEEIRHALTQWSEPQVCSSAELNRALNLSRYPNFECQYFYGDFDVKYREQGRRLSQVYPAARVQGLPGRGHRLLNLNDFKQIFA